MRFAGLKANDRRQASEMKEPKVCLWCGNYYEEPGITIYHGDCRDILPSLPKVDLVLTDPPYGINVDKEMHEKGGQWYF